MTKSNNWELAEAVIFFQGKLTESKMNLTFGKADLFLELENLQKVVLENDATETTRIANIISNIATKNLTFENEVKYYEYQISCVDGSNKQN